MVGNIILQKHNKEIHNFRLVNMNRIMDYLVDFTLANNVRRASYAFKCWSYSGLES